MAVAVKQSVADEGAAERALAPEDRARADFARLLSNALSAPPSAEFLNKAIGLQGDASPLGVSVSRWAAAAGAADRGELGRAYFDLFIGVGRGELVPFGSYYLTGFLQEKPLAELRRDMQRLGIAPADQASDPEDHVAAVLEMYAGLIDGAFPAPVDLDVQRSFFDRHVNAWMPVFFRDLEANERSAYFAALGAVGRQYLAIEEAAFAIL